jgi:SAM-dependent methyltransferase
MTLQVFRNIIEMLPCVRAKIFFDMSRQTLVRTLAMSELPSIHNTRSPAQWEIISRHIDFADKTVIDLGCGYGDLLFRIADAGAEIVIGVENDFSIYQKLQKRSRGWPEIVVSPAHIYDVLPDVSGYDVAICFSVLPYLERWYYVLRWMRRFSKVALIEVQYQGDGPGRTWPARIRDDYQMRILLELLWDDVSPIGKTHVEGRGVDRTIWLCK